MAHTNSWDESTPLPTEDASTADDYLRNHRLDLGERLEDMFYGFNAASNAAPENDYGVKSFRFYKQTSDPTAATDCAHVYVKLVDGVPELFYQDDENTTKQLTVGGALKCVAGDYGADSIDEDDIQPDNDSYLVAANAAADGEVDLIKAGTNDLATLPDSAEMASNAAPVEDEAIVNKKYVDDQIPAVIPDGMRVKAWVVFDGADADPDSTKTSYNVASITDNGTGDYTITWTNAFSSTSYVVVANAAQERIVGVSTIAADTVRIKVDSEGGTPFDSKVYLMAIGTLA